MNYKVRVGGEDLVVPEDTARKLKSKIELGKRDGFFASGDSYYQLRDVRSVVSIADEKRAEVELTGKYRKLNDDYDVRLRRWASEDAKTKTEREIRYRVTPALKHFREKFDLHDFAKEIYTFFVSNPKYPWCPLEIWLKKFGTRKMLPTYFHAVVALDRRVEEFLNIRSESYEFESAINLLDGGIDA